MARLNSTRFIPILSILIGLLTILPGAQKLLNDSGMIEEFNNFGMPHWMLLYILV